MTKLVPEAVTDFNNEANHLLYLYFNEVKLECVDSSILVVP